MTPGAPVRNTDGSTTYTGPDGRTSVVKGAIQAAYDAAGAGRSRLGLPDGDEFPVRDGGRVQRFDRGLVYWTPATGAHVVEGAIRELYAARGWENSPLGYPTSDEIRLRDGGVVQRYQGALVYWTPGTGAQDVKGAIGERYATLGWENSPLGYPRSGEYAVPGGVRQDYQRGSMTYEWATRRVTLS
ncbi:LGFP repeat-containing protein [Kineococcus gypseus]|uniref:LGFP repeat-containing protein n=1 Tax=Kineococcus gypseus TaxID=1637102 RepID=UPI003D7E47B7